MSIATMVEKGKEWARSIPKDVLFLLVSLLAVSASFGLGMITEREMGKHEGVQFGTFDEALPANVVSATENIARPSPEAFEQAAKATPAGGVYVASKSGTRYYLPSCSGAARIKEENKIWFPSKEEAEAAGLTAASNCPGL